MIALFHPQDIPEVVGVQGLDMRSIGTEAVFRDNELEVRMILAQLGYKLRIDTLNRQGLANQR